MKNLQVPKARNEGLVIQEWPEEVLVYDLIAHKAHHLNETAMFVWNSCDGKNSISEIAGLLEKHLGQKVTDDIVWLAIDQLLEKGLLSGNVDSGLQNRSRREVIRKIGLGTALVIPVVASLVAPASIQAASGCLCDPANNNSNTGFFSSECFSKGCGRTCNNGICAESSGSCVCPRGPGVDSNAFCVDSGCPGFCNASGLCV